MRKTLIGAVALLVALGMLAPPVMAQAPAPKVTINGLVDMVNAWNRNISQVDFAAGDRRDAEWYTRSRFRPDIVGEVGTTKMVLGLELDYVFGQMNTTRFGIAAPQVDAGRLNLDAPGVLEVKWAYLEFQMPWIPMATTVRLGGQPFATMYKPGILAHGDFAGIHVTSALTPVFRLNLTYAQVEERSFGPARHTTGDDFAFIGSVEFSPMKGLDIRPLYSFFFAEGTTSGSSRQARGGVNTGLTTIFPGPAQALTADERRHTLGVDARWRFGPFSVDPTLLYQFGRREMIPAGAAALVNQRRSALFFDLRGGWRSGPLLLELAGIYTTGNRAGDDLPGGARMRFYEPINVDSGFYGGWSEIFALNIDYLQNLYGAAGGLGFINSIGYDKYGLINLGARASYALTPAFTVRGGINARWTAQQVDTTGTIAAATGLTPGDGIGNDRYLGTEILGGFQWRFAPNVAFDLVGAHLFAGDALGSATSTGLDGIVRDNTNPGGVTQVAARVRYTF
jgi:hypothetical protein